MELCSLKNLELLSIIELLKKVNDKNKLIYFKFNDNNASFKIIDDNFIFKKRFKTINYQRNFSDSLVINDKVYKLTGRLYNFLNQFEKNDSIQLVYSYYKENHRLSFKKKILNLMLTAHLRNASGIGEVKFKEAINNNKTRNYVDNLKTRSLSSYKLKEDLKHLKSKNITLIGDSISESELDILPYVKGEFKDTFNIDSYTFELIIDYISKFQDSFSVPVPFYKNNVVRFNIRNGYFYIKGWSDTV